MTTTQERRAGARPIARRSWLGAARPVVALTAAVAAGTLFVLTRLVGGLSEGATDDLQRLATELGTSASPHLATALGVVATVLFGILIAIIGSQVVLGDAEAETSVKTALGLIATLSLLALVPAMTVALIAAVGSPELRGALLVSVPVFVALGALVVVIHTIEPGDDPTLLRIAERERRQAGERLDRLAGMPGTGTGQAVVVTSAGLAVITLLVAAIVLLVDGGRAVPDPSTAVRALVIAVVFLAAVVSVLIAVDAELKAEASPVRTANAAGYLLTAAGLYGLGITTAGAVSGPVGLGMAGAGAALVLLTLRVLQEARAVRDGRVTAADAWWNGGPVVRAGTGTARRAAQRTADAAQGRAEQLRLRLAERTPAPEAEAPATAPDVAVPDAPEVAEPAPGLRRRLRRAIAALVDEG
ncbi:hypothetical protein NLU66_00105 [Brachybacterium sp. NBEC-018]|uniref:hypothetical protein n=1 Tax=Brachybacterium sp. NBEC-018 TaxID=2996004 RepID=UPI0021751B5D|nr:hypothetical protein [Brachybacterium sp. NBEC-018]UVY84031.1 hypothetical protein NLU66_00105 [Brachybacterium sp. NBEC-018]